MEFLTVREFMSAPKRAWGKLESDGEIAITNNGKPTAVMLHVTDGGFDETVALIRQARAMRLMDAVWAEAAVRGTLSDAEIAEEIAAARAEKQHSDA
jgi:hypothetical protein